MKPTGAVVTDHAGAERTRHTADAGLGRAGQVRVRMEMTADLLRQKSSAADARKILAELRIFLEGLPRSLASGAVVAFLEADTDAATGLEFGVGPGGTLTGAPSLRVFLLDLLAVLDPVAAARSGGKILQTATSPDEWAVAMRNFGRAFRTPRASAFLSAKAAEMIRNEAWLENPSAGFLEAFDVFVHTRDTAATPLLASLVRDQGERAAAHAAYLTLDRLVIAEPRAVFAQIEQQPGIFEGRELMQSNFFARADVRDAGQRAHLEKYLLDAARTAAELNAFADLYPNANYLISPNLLTSPEPRPQSDRATRDRAALRVIDEWLADPRFQRIQPHLQTIRNRLQTFVSPPAPSAL
jgi:hypothetical protein